MTIPSKMKGESEFGSGLVICLVKFAEHAEKWLQLRAEYTRMQKLSSGRSGFFSESAAVGMFFNGASDHLHRIEVPERFRGTELERKVTKLRDSALDIGHSLGSLIGRKKYTAKHVERAYDLCREIAMMVDRELGLEPDIGQH